MLGVVLYSVVACVTFPEIERAPRNGWWGARGPVVPHDTFPAECSLCHVGKKWQHMSDDFTFDHAAETGVPLHGAHDQAQCLRCHNDRGPVEVFSAQGCAGCHQDVHLGQLGPRCTECHQETTWQSLGHAEFHSRTRFPLVGVHASTSCRRCHVGAEVGRFTPTPIECLSCHQDDFARANTPNHIALGWVNQCDRCHMPTDWARAELDQ